MSTFSTTTLDPAVLDPRKRVRYATGLVLGVDEFQQDQTYLMERDRRHQRALHGYGTVYGLDVRARVRDGAAEVVVMPGLAVDPRGRDICVPEPQCARLDAWLAAHADEVRDTLGSFPDAAALYVLLCYRECETDLVPIPGSPCRSEDDARAPSRIADHFELRLALEPPAYAEEAAVRRFGSLLRRLRVSDEAPVLTADALADLVRAIPEATGEGPAEPLHLHPAEAASLLRLAFRLWTVEVRPQLGGEGGCAVPTTDACVLLGRLDVVLAEDGDGFVVDAAAPPGDGGVPGVRIRQEGRPYLLSTRVLQEWLHLCTCAAEEEPGSFPDEQILLALNDLIDVEAAPSAGDVLTWDAEAGVWVAAPPADGGGTSDHGALTGLGDDDHPQYLPVDGSRPMGADLDLGGNRVVNLDTATGNGQAVPFQQAVKQGDAAGGDLADTYPDPTVRALQGRPVAATAPATNQVLRWNGTAWAPQTLVIPQPNPGNFEEGLVRIMGHNWRHGLDLEFTALPRVLVQDEDREITGLVVEFGREEPGDAEVRVGWGSVDFFSFQVSLSVFQGAFYQTAGLAPVRIDPVDVLGRGNVWQVRVRPDVDEDGMVDAPAVLFRFDPALVQQLPRTGALVTVLLRGDFIRDTEGRAIDAEYLRQQLPTGDRPDGSRIGLQGGRFESWFFVLGTGDLRGGIAALGGLAEPRDTDEPAPPTPDVRDRFAGMIRGRAGGGRVVDVNTATREELVTLPHVGRALADRIIAAREAEGTLDSPEALRRVSGVSERILEGLRGRIRFQ